METEELDYKALNEKSAEDLNDLGIRYYNEKYYKEAFNIFKKAVAKGELGFVK